MKRKGFLIFILFLALLFVVFVVMKTLGGKNPVYSVKNKEALAHYKKGVNYAMKYYLNDAEKEFQLAVKLDPSFPLPYIYLISLSSGFKEGKIASYYKKIAVPQKSWSDFEKEFVSIFLEATAKRGKLRGDVKFAKKLQDFINRYADRVEIYPILLPMYQKAVGDRDKLIKYYTYLHHKYPNNTQILNSLGYFYLAKGDYKNAENCFKKYKFIAPNNANPYDSIADLYFSLGDYDKAIVNYKRAIEIKPDFYNSKVKLALCYIYTGRLKKAQETISLIEGDSKDIPYLKYLVYPLRSFVYYSSRNLEKLSQLYESFKPDKRYVCFKVLVDVNYAVMVKDKKLLSQSVKEGEHCYKMVRDMVKPLKILALGWEGKDREAEKLIQKALKKFKSLLYDKRLIYAQVITIYYISKKKYEKINPFLKYLKDGDKWYAEFLIARAKGDKKDCIKFAKKLVEYYNESDDNFYKKKEAMECLK